MGQPEKENIFGLTSVPSFLNDKSNNWVDYKQKNKKKIKPENGRNNKNGSNSNHNYTSQNFGIIYDALGGNNSNENCALQNFDIINDALRGNNSNDNCTLQNFDNINDILKENNSSDNLEKAKDVLKGNNSNDNCASQDFDTIYYALKGNNSNSNEEKTELFKDLDEDYKTNPNINGNFKTECVDKNTSKKTDPSSNIVNSSTKGVTEESSFQRGGEELNQNYFDNNFDFGKIEVQSLNNFHLEFNTSFENSFEKSPNNGADDNYSDKQPSNKSEDKDNFLNLKTCNFDISKNNNYRKFFPLNSFFYNDKEFPFLADDDDHDDDNSFMKINLKSNNNNLNISPANLHINNNEGILYNPGVDNNPFHTLKSNNNYISLDNGDNLFEFNDNIINLDENENGIDLKTLNIKEFNCDVFQENYSYYKKEYNYVEPKFIEPKEFIKKYHSELEDLWSGQDAIFDNEFDLLNRNGVIYKDLKNFLANYKIHPHKKDRRFYSDNMSEKIKTKLNEMIYIPFNEYFKKEIKIFYQTKKSKNNGKNDYNYVLLEMPIYSILSNNEDNKQNIQKFIDKYDGKREKDRNLLEYLYSKFEDCLQYFLFIKKGNDSMFNNENIVKYLKAEYKKLCYDNVNIETTNKEIKREKKIKNKEDLKDYIASLLLLAYNLKRLYYLKRGRNFKK